MATQTIATKKSGRFSNLRLEAFRTFRHETTVLIFVRGERQLQSGRAVRRDPDHRLGKVLRLPARGELELELQVRMVEDALAEESMTRVCSIYQAVDVPEIRLFPDGRIRLRRFGRPCTGGLDAFGGRGMRGQPVRNAAAFLPRGRTLERGEDVGGFLRLVAGLGRVLEAQLVRFTLVVPAVLQEQQLEPGADER